MTKDELNKQGAEIPTAWLIIIPFVSIWWMWKYSEGVEKVTQNKISTVLAFVLLWVLGCIGQAIIQDAYNKLQPVATAPAATPFTPAPLPPSPIQGDGDTTPAQPPTDPTQPAA